ncbi:hypothetical protein TSUD_227290 [Trifolium subterraneum]|uniref:Late embryogenesis abundant protein LEA-2 subgroup domain-containing protein n=1 Tax=Trifolium subterraneum TaxID=3900 RepID=A0A2Z6MA14_TRISU|nr:hypothetical protein TSUD_227290 [Trifolium subterraneum]
MDKPVHQERILLISASILQLRNLEIKLTSATLNQTSYKANSSSPSFNATIMAYFSIWNPNFGGIFNYEYSNMKVLYSGVKVGITKIPNDRVNQRETKHVNVTVIVKFAKIVHKRKIIDMACIMNLNLTSQAIQGIHC